MRRSSAWWYLGVFVICWVFLLGKLYEKGKVPGALIYAEIPKETVQYFEKLVGKLDVLVRYNPEIRPRDWQDKYNYGEDPKTGLKKIEDDYFIIYFDDGNKQLSRAEKLLKWAHDAISESQKLMGKYPFPVDVNNRKLPIYMARNTDQYASLAETLRGYKFDVSSTSGLYLSDYSRMGNLTIGILLSSVIWRDDTYAKHVLWHEMNHYVYFTLLEYDKVVRPYMWVYEGLAEYFSQYQPLKLQKEQVEMCEGFTLTATFPNYVANYWGGQSVYEYMEKTYGKGKVEGFIHSTYEAVTESAIKNTFQKEVGVIEGEWKRWLRE